MRTHSILALLALGVLGCGSGRSEAPPSSESARSEEAVDSVPMVAIEGYGARLVLHPPFMVNRAPVGPNGHADQLIHAHPDGSRILNLMIIPSVPSGEPSEIRATTDLPGFEVVPDGTRVILGQDMSDLHGVADLGVGPTDPSWTIVAGDDRTPWPVGRLLRSTESAPGFELVDPGTP